MEALIYMALGATLAGAWRVLRRAVHEMDDLDAIEESWKSIMFMEYEEGR